MRFLYVQSPARSRQRQYFLGLGSLLFDPAPAETTALPGQPKYVTVSFGRSRLFQQYTRVCRCRWRVWREWSSWEASPERKRRGYCENPKLLRGGAHKNTDSSQVSMLLQGRSSQGHWVGPQQAAFCPLLSRPHLTQGGASLDLHLEGWRSRKTGKRIWFIGRVMG